jgi:hypothetical protein
MEKKNAYKNYTLKRLKPNKDELLLVIYSIETLSKDYGLSAYSLKQSEIGFKDILLFYARVIVKAL